MKLLFDNNLSQKLVRQMASLYPGSTHVTFSRLDTASDLEVWQYAQQKGFPPKVKWIRLGNCTTAEIAALLQKHHGIIIDFAQDKSVGLLELQ